jgi:hypothetical protein
LNCVILEEVGARQLSPTLNLDPEPLTKQAQRGAGEQAHPFWLRVLTFAFLLLVVGASSVQAIHIHGEWLPQNAIHAGSLPTGSQAPGGEEHCPLCIAMHSALPVTAHVNAVLLTLVECKAVQAFNRVPETQWHYAMFSRPPPVETL